MTTPLAILSIGADQYLDQIEAALERYCVSLEHSHKGSPRLNQAIRYCLTAPGKRIRPLLVLSATQACGGIPSSALPAACAVEMIHNYSLIHDDLPAMDDDDLRRGRPTCHIQFDEATAILAGDALIPFAFEVIANEIRPAETALACVLALAKAAGPLNLVGGQADDLQHQFAEGDLAMLERIHHRKTGALLSVSLELGAIIAGADLAARENLIKYGKNLGLAFQITDDLLDLRGTANTIGKRTGKDADRGKLTYPGLIGESASLERASEMAEAAISAISSLGPPAAPLERLARFIVTRTR